MDAGYSYLDKNKAMIGGSIRKTFKDPIIQLEIKASISEIITKNLNKMIFAFVPPETISEKIYGAVDKYLDDEKTDDDIVFVLKRLLEKLYKTKVVDLTSGLNESLDGNGIERLTCLVVDILKNEKNQAQVIKIFREKLESDEVKNKDIIKEKLLLGLNSFLESDDFHNKIKDFTEWLFEEIRRMNIGYFFGKINDVNMEKIYGLSSLLFKKFAKNELGKIVDLFNIEKIVEEKINSFPVEQFEELVLEIAHKELRAITWLGGLLGAILGLLSPLLQTIY